MMSHKLLHIPFTPIFVTEFSELLKNYPIILDRFIKIFLRIFFYCIIKNHVLLKYKLFTNNTRYFAKFLWNILKHSETFISKWWNISQIILFYNYFNLRQFSIVFQNFLETWTFAINEFRLCHNGSYKCNHDTLISYHLSLAQWHWVSWLTKST